MVDLLSRENEFEDEVGSFYLTRRSRVSRLQRRAAEGARSSFARGRRVSRADRSSARRAVARRFVSPLTPSSSRSPSARAHNTSCTRASPRAPRWARSSTHSSPRRRIRRTCTPGRAAARERRGETGRQRSIARGEGIGTRSVGVSARTSLRKQTTHKTRSESAREWRHWDDSTRAHLPHAVTPGGGCDEEGEISGR
jgi:hypothetical protein